MIRAAIQISRGSPLITPRLSLKTGDILPAKVITQISAQNYHLAFRGVTLLVKSRVPLIPGESVLLDLQKIDGANLNSQFSRLYARLGITDNSFSQTFLMLAFKYHLPLVQEHLSLLYNSWKRFRGDQQTLREQLLEPYFFQQAAINSGIISDPLFFVRWFRGQYHLQKSLKKWTNGNDGRKKTTATENGAPEDVPGTALPVAEKISLPAVREWLRFALGSKIELEDVLKLYQTADSNKNLRSDHSSGSESGERLNAFANPSSSGLKTGCGRLFPFQSEKKNSSFF